MNDKIYILKGKDCTERIRSIRVLPNGKYEVTFKGQPQRFTYNPNNVNIETAKSTIDSSKCVVQVNGKVENNVEEIKEYGNYYRIAFGSGFTKSVPIRSTNLIGSCLDDKETSKKFDYFKTIAREISLFTEDGKNILGGYYDKIDFIRDDTILKDYFTGEITDNYIGTTSHNIFPFGFNPSQKIATENAMNYKMSVIQGPPGTGKTQTILNIIANIIKNEKTVAVVSNNNSVTDNINEKLREYDVDFIAARLGSVKNKQDFIFNQSVPAKEKLESWNLDYYTEHELNQKIEYLTGQINEILDYKNEQSKLKTELDNLNTEKVYFDNYDRTNPAKLIPATLRRPITSDKILDFWYELEKINRGENSLTFWCKVKFWFTYKVKIDNFFKQDFSNIVRVLQRLYYKTQSSEINNKIKELSDYISANNLDEKISEHKKLSKQIFQSHIAKRYLNNGERKHYSLDDLWKNSEDFIKDYPVVLSTTYSLRNSLAYNYVYDYVVIDESSQVDLATFVLALSCAKRAVIVGDEKQLPNVVDSQTRTKDVDIFGKYNIPNEYMFSTHSALSAVTDLFGDKVPSQLLREHYRCHPKIIGFCNKTFYDDQLITLTPPTKNTHDPLKIYYTVKGNHAREDHINQRQIDVTFGEVIAKEGLNLYDNTVGIVTPYRNHAKALRHTLATIGADKTVLAATVDKFQGRERDVIIINTVDNKISDFASNPNRLNVAVSRARNQLIIVTNGNDNSAHSGIDELLDYIRYNNFEITQSEVRSVFDYLYSAYYKRKRVEEVSNYYSENLMFDLVNKVLKTHGYNNLKCVPQYPLKMLCDVTKLSRREKEYAINDWTLVDFVIFKKTSKIPVLAIEVDGWAFHRADNVEGDKQKERDINKDNILAKFNVPLIRFSTTGSDEDKRLLDKLKSVMNERE